MNEQKPISIAEFAKSIKPFNKYSQFGEDGIIEAIFARIGTANKYCVECGAADGILFSNTRKLIEEGWRSVQIEADFERFDRLRSLYAGNDNVVTANVKIGMPPNAFSFEEFFDGLPGLGLPLDFDLLVIDVDGQDYYLWNSLLRYQPRVVICEYDPLTDPEFIPQIAGAGQAGERAIHLVALARGYQVVGKTQVNLVCVRNDLVRLLADESPEVHSGLRAMGAMTPVGDNASPETPQPLSEPLVCSRTAAEVLIYGYTEQQLIDARAQRQSEGNLMVAACMSTPRFGPLITMDLIQTALFQFGIPWFRGEGGYWHHQLTDSIERALTLHPDAILTFDYDSVFCTAPNSSDIAKLVTLLIENPEVDVIAPMQMKREGGALLANSKGEVVISDPLIPVDWAHFGMTIFRASVFKRLSKPWFWERPDENGGWGEGRIDADIGFWKNCQEHGVRLCVATDVLLGHGEYNVTYPGDDLKPIYVSMNQWRKNGQKPPAEAFNRQRFIEKALRGEMAIAKVLDMGN